MLEMTRCLRKSILDSYQGTFEPRELPQAGLEKLSLFRLIRASWSDETDDRG